MSNSHYECFVLIGNIFIWKKIYIHIFGQEFWIKNKFLPINHSVFSICHCRQRYKYTIINHPTLLLILSTQKKLIIKSQISIERLFETLGNIFKYTNRDILFLKRM